MNIPAVATQQQGLQQSATFVTALPQRRIAAVELTKVFETESGPHRVLDNLNFAIGPGERMAILGRNGAGKSTLIKLLAGIDSPTFGRIDQTMSLSWPLALGGGFEWNMTGYDNVRFISQLYNMPFRETFDFVVDFSEIGKYIFEPVRVYSSGMRMRLAFALSLAIDFDCFLIDEVLFVGDVRFQKKCHYEIFERRKDRSMILAIHSAEIVKEFCTSALVLRNGRGRVFHDLNLASDIYMSL